MIFRSFTFPFVVADRVVAQRTFTLNECTLTAEHYFGPSAEEDNFNDSGISEESDLESCTIEVSGIKKETSQETVRMFFARRGKSGGGDIDSIWCDQHNGKYIITFSERACKF